jgi:hypothetical protein
MLHHQCANAARVPTDEAIKPSSIHHDAMCERAQTESIRLSHETGVAHRWSAEEDLALWVTLVPEFPDELRIPRARRVAC